MGKEVSNLDVSVRHVIGATGPPQRGRETIAAWERILFVGGGSYILPSLSSGLPSSTLSNMVSPNGGMNVKDR